MISKKLFFEDASNEVSEEVVNSLQDRIKEEQKEIGFYGLPTDSNDTLDKIYKFILSNNAVYKGKIKNLVILGIGGSSLGTKAIDTALKHTKNRNNIKLIFLENCDPNEINSSLKGVSAKDSMFIMISKSGSTIETTSLAKLVIYKFFDTLENSKLKKRFLIVTDEGSPLDKFGAEFSLERFYIAPNVGGRFSVLSAVGLLPLAILGYDIRKLLLGASKLKKSFFDGNERQMIQKAAYLVQNFERYPINVLFSYSSSLEKLTAWYVQLWAESLGKINTSGQSVGLTPIGLIGSVDQHSFLQLVIEGPKNKTVTFIKVKDFKNSAKIPNISIKNLEKTDFVNGLEFAHLLNSQCEATMETLVEKGVKVDLIELDSLNEESVGSLIFYFELLTAVAGVHFGINTYDQPGVESGKIKLFEKLNNKN
jgi:glucose-6-phosphate isomerase